MFMPISRVREAFNLLTRWDGGHLIFTGRHWPNGRGKFHYGKRDYQASWIGWLLEYGSFPKHQLNHIDELCDILDCVYWKHYYDGTSKENVQDMILAGTHNSVTLNNGALWKPGRLHPQYGIRGPFHFNYGKRMSREFVEQKRQLFLRDNPMSRPEVREKLSMQFRDGRYLEVKLLRALGFTQQAIADRLGIHQTTVYRMIIRGY